MSPPLRSLVHNKTNVGFKLIFVAQNIDAAVNIYVSFIFHEIENMLKFHTFKRYKSVIYIKIKIVYTTNILPINEEN